MFFNKNLIIMASLLLAHQVTAMKRNAVSECDRSSKRFKTSSSYHNWVGHQPISSTWNTQPRLVQFQRNNQSRLLPYPVAPYDLKALPIEQKAFSTKFCQPHHEKMISHGISKADSQKIEHHVSSMDATSFDHNDLVVRIFSTKKLNQEEKINCAKKLEAIGVDMARTDFNTQLRGASGLRSIKRAPLHIAVEREEVALVEHFLRSGINPNIEGKRGAAIFYARDLETIEALTRAGANLSARDKYGNTALHLMAGSQPEEKEVAAYFLSHGVPFDAKDMQDLTPYAKGKLIYGEEFTNPALADHEKAAQMTRSAIVQTVGKPMVRFLHDRQIGNKKSFLNSTFEYDAGDNDRDE